MPQTTPRFVLDGNHWTTKAFLPSWKGIQNWWSPQDSLVGLVPSNGEVEIGFAPEGRGKEPLTASEIASIVWVIENEASISEALFQSLLKGLPTLVEQFGLSEEEKKELIPDIQSVDDLHAHIGLAGVFVHQVQKDGIPYVGFRFHCTWDDEHGLGVLMHGTRAVDIGGADTSFLLWIAKRDGGVKLA
jgi:hypothetical protein